MEGDAIEIILTKPPWMLDTCLSKIGFGLSSWWLVFKDSFKLEPNIAKVCVYFSFKIGLII